MRSLNPVEFLRNFIAAFRTPEDQIAIEFPCWSVKVRVLAAGLVLRQTQSFLLVVGLRHCVDSIFALPHSLFHPEEARLRSFFFRLDHFAQTDCVKGRLVRNSCQLTLYQVGAHAPHDGSLLKSHAELLTRSPRSRLHSILPHPRSPEAAIPGSLFHFYQ
jgi:hypothetical protein